jgi:hypothetical protein
MSELVGAVLALRRGVSDETLARAAAATRAARADGNPWARSLARGVTLVVDLCHDGELAAAQELLDGELTRSLPDEMVPTAATRADSVLA